MANVFHEVLLKFGLLLSDKRQGMVIDISGNRAVSKFSQNLGLKRQQQGIDGFLLL